MQRNVQTESLRVDSPLMRKVVIDKKKQENVIIFTSKESVGPSVNDNECLSRKMITSVSWDPL